MSFAFTCAIFGTGIQHSSRSLSRMFRQDGLTFRRGLPVSFPQNSDIAKPCTLIQIMTYRSAFGYFPTRTAGPKHRHNVPGERERLQALDDIEAADWQSSDAAGSLPSKLLSVSLVGFPGSRPHLKARSFRAAWMYQSMKGLTVKSASQPPAF